MEREREGEREGGREMGTEAEMKRIGPSAEKQRLRIVASQNSSDSSRKESTAIKEWERATNEWRRGRRSAFMSSSGYMLGNHV